MIQEKLKKDRPKKVQAKNLKMIDFDGQKYQTSTVFTTLTLHYYTKLVNTLGNLLDFIQNKGKSAVLII